MNGNSPVPAFLQREDQTQYQQQMQQIQRQPQYNYQSADPNSATYTLPPAVYQPAPGDTPAFIAQPQDQQPTDDQTLKTNEKEDVIQINFTDDQYKSQDEVTPLNKDEAIKYNNEVKQQQQQNAPTEIPEGAVYDASQVREGAISPSVNDATANKEKEKQLEKTSVPEPKKAQSNIMRINYSQEVTELSDKDKASLLEIVRLLKNNRSQKILIISNTSERDIGVSAEKISLMRVIAIRDYLMKQGVDFSQTEVKVKPPERNKENLDYIDIDKI